MKKTNKNNVFKKREFKPGEGGGGYVQVLGKMGKSVPQLKDLVESKGGALINANPKDMFALLWYKLYGLGGIGLHDTSFRKQRMENGQQRNSMYELSGVFPQSSP